MTGPVPASPVAGLLLAAGQGRRAGGPKALRRDPDGVTWVARSLRVLLDGGCDEVVVVVGAADAQVRAVLDEAGFGDPETGRRPRVAVVEATDWATGMGASLRAGLTALAAAGSAAGCACVHLVDLPDVGPDVVARLIAGAGPSTLARAVYDGRPGHPVLLGRDHWTAASHAAQADRGARGYLSTRQVRLVDCSDLAGGRDVDTPPEGEPAHRGTSSA